MNRILAIGLAVAALSAALSFDAIGGTEQQRVANANAGAGMTPYYVRGPRIIHVPRPGDEIETRADDQAHDRADDDVAPAHRRKPAPRHRSVRKAPKIKARAAKTVVTKPRVRSVSRATLRSEAPPPPPPKPLGPRRAVLSAPPPRAEGPSPIYPTPRFEANAQSAEKFERPRQTETVAGPPPPAPVPPVTNELPAATDN